MTLRVVARAAESLQTYAAVSIAFAVTEIVDLDAAQPGAQAELTTRKISAPYVKDYDSIAGNHPTDWPMRYQVDNWVIFTAHEGGRQIAGLIVVGDAELVPEPTAMLLWDLRVAPRRRLGGIGRKLLASAEAVVRERGVRDLYAETQDVNAGACRFYARQGFVLDGVTRDAYPELAGETRLLWKKHL